MRLNPECIKDILLYLDTIMVPDEHGNINEIRPEEIAVSSELSKYPQGIILYHIKQMFKSDLLEKGSQYIHQDTPAISDISPEGYRFLDSAKENTLWKKVLDTAKEYGSIALPKLIELVLNQPPA